MNDWVYGKHSKSFFGEIYDAIDGVRYEISKEDDYITKLLPEMFLGYQEIFGRLIFIKYLIKEKIVTLKV